MAERMAVSRQTVSKDVSQCDPCLHRSPAGMTPALRPAPR
ncbi:MAG: hypothetical protein J6K53_02235 [Roseburia sp.]|nr:hypothetical protein [Roseburia sp.]